MCELFVVFESVWHKRGTLMMMSRPTAGPTSGGSDSTNSDDLHEIMTPPLSGLRMPTAPLALYCDDPAKDEGETLALLGSESPPATPPWLSRLEKGPYNAADKSLHMRSSGTRSDEWELVASLDGTCCGLRKPRLVEVVQLRHANYGLRWSAVASNKKNEDHRNPVVRDQELRTQPHDDDDDGAALPATNNAPFCVVGPHWWLMAATFTVFTVAALSVTMLTVPQAGPGEAVMGMLLSIACLFMYAKVGCTNPGIVGHLDEPLDDDYTYCGECESYRPPGALHCLDCRVCIEDYDHHCPWTGKCIGKRNVKYFYAWLFFLVLAFVYEMIEFTTYMLPPDHQPRLFDSEDGDSFYAVSQKKTPREDDEGPDAVERTMPSPSGAPSVFRQP